MSYVYEILRKPVNYIVAPILFLPMIVSMYLVISGYIFTVPMFTFFLFFFFYCATVLGITVGFHRLMTHRSFKTNPYVKFILLCFGCMAYEGPPSFWIGAHRKHHIDSDSTQDPHTPYINNKVSITSFFKSHIGWMLLLERKDWRPYIADLRGDNIVRFCNRFYIYIAMSGLFIPAMINGLYFMSWVAFLEGFLIAGVFRVFLMHQVTWSINSVCHIFGKQHFVCKDKSKNNVLFGILALGEGWHNGHHAFPRSARHGLLWWQLDVSYLLILALSKLGLAYNIHTPSKTALKEKQIKALK